MVKITVGIEGMACGMCEAHINDAVSVSSELYEKKGLFGKAGRKHEG